MIGASGQADQVERSFDRLCVAKTADAETELDVLLCGEMLDEQALLGHVSHLGATQRRARRFTQRGQRSAGNRDLAAVGELHSRYETEQRRLAGTRRTGDHVERSGV